MKKSFVLVSIFLILSAQVATGQDHSLQKFKTIDRTQKNQPTQQVQDIQPVSKAKLRSDVTVINVRNVASSVLRSNLDPNITSNKVMQPAGSAAEATSLDASQLAEILGESGMQFTPANLYMRLSPKQTSEAGKGYLHPYKPHMLVPDFMIFDEFFTGEDSSAGVHIVLKEAGTYVLDFLIELIDGNSTGTVYPCQVLKGISSSLQTVNVAKADGPQHVLVVVNYDGAKWSSYISATGVNVNQLYGLHFDKPEGGYYSVKWKFYRVDVTKM